MTREPNTVAQRLSAWTHWLAFGAAVTGLWTVLPAPDTALLAAAHRVPPTHAPNPNPATDVHANHENETDFDQGTPGSTAPGR